MSENNQNRSEIEERLTTSPVVVIPNEISEILGDFVEGKIDVSLAATLTVFERNDDPDLVSGLDEPDNIFEEFGDGNIFEEFGDGSSLSGEEGMEFGSDDSELEEDIGEEEEEEVSCMYLYSNSHFKPIESINAFDDLYLCLQLTKNDDMDVLENLQYSIKAAKEVVRRGLHLGFRKKVIKAFKFMSSRKTYDKEKIMDKMDKSFLFCKDCEILNDSDILIIRTYIMDFLHEYDEKKWYGRSKSYGLFCLKVGSWDHLQDLILCMKQYLENYFREKSKHRFLSLEKENLFLTMLEMEMRIRRKEYHLVNEYLNNFKHANIEDLSGLFLFQYFEYLGKYTLLTSSNIFLALKYFEKSLSHDPSFQICRQVKVASKKTIELICFTLLCFGYRESIVESFKARREGRFSSKTCLLSNKGESEYENFVKRCKYQYKANPKIDVIIGLSESFRIRNMEQFRKYLSEFMNLANKQDDYLIIKFLNYFRELTKNRYYRTTSILGSSDSNSKSLIFNFRCVGEYRKFDRIFHHQFFHSKTSNTNKLVIIGGKYDIASNWKTQNYLCIFDCTKKEIEYCEKILVLPKFVRETKKEYFHYFDSSGDYQQTNLQCQIDRILIKKPENQLYLCYRGGKVYCCELEKVIDNLRGIHYFREFVDCSGNCIQGVKFLRNDIFVICHSLGSSKYYDRIYLDIFSGGVKSTIYRYNYGETCEKYNHYDVVLENFKIRRNHILFFHSLTGERQGKLVLMNCGRREIVNQRMMDMQTSNLQAIKIIEFNREDRVILAFMDKIQIFDFSLEMKINEIQIPEIESKIGNRFYTSQIVPISKNNELFLLSGGCFGVLDTKNNTIHRGFSIFVRNSPITISLNTEETQITRKIIAVDNGKDIGVFSISDKTSGNLEQEDLENRMEFVKYDEGLKKEKIKFSFSSEQGFFVFRSFLNL